jgi:hypothetical protein
MTGLMKDSSIRWVGAADRRPNACLIAATAMIVGKQYEHVASEIGQAMTDPVLRRYFAVCGFAVAEFPKWDLFSSHDPAEGAVPGDLLIEGRVFPQRAVWPLAPFAPVHLCITAASASSESAHAVILLGNGDVLDPGTVEFQSPRPRRLSEYSEVRSMWGLWKVMDSMLVSDEPSPAQFSELPEIWRPRQG